MKILSCTDQGLPRGCQEAHHILQVVPALLPGHRRAFSDREQPADGHRRYVAANGPGHTSITDEWIGTVYRRSHCFLEVIGTRAATPRSVACREMTTTGRRFLDSGKCRHSGSANHTRTLFLFCGAGRNSIRLRGGFLIMCGFQSFAFLKDFAGSAITMEYFLAPGSV